MCEGLTCKLMCSKCESQPEAPCKFRKYPGVHSTFELWVATYKKDGVVCLLGAYKTFEEAKAKRIEWENK